MAYIGKTPSSGIRNRFIYTATAGQTTFSGTDDHSRTLSYTDAEFTDVFLNGVKLDKSDYTATSGTSIVLDEGAAVDDILEVLAFDTFSVFSGEFSQDVTVGGNVAVNGTLDVNGNELILDADGDTSITADTDDQIDFKTGGTDRVTIDSSGNVGIGTSSPSAGLHIDNPDNGAITAILDTDNSAVKMIFRNNTEAGNNVQIGADGSSLVAVTGGSERMRIDSSGNILLGKTSTAIDPAGCMLKPSGEVFATTSGLNTYHYYDTSQNRYEFYVKGNGGIANYSSNNVNLSDQTEKKNITAAASAWDDVKGLAVKEFHYNFEDDADPKQLGVIAQDVQVNHPDLIKSFKIDDSTTKLGVIEQQITWMAIKALQEAITKIETLETENTTQATQIADLITRVAALEASD